MLLKPRPSYNPGARDLQIVRAKLEKVEAVRSIRELGLGISRNDCFTTLVSVSTGGRL